MASKFYLLEMIFETIPELRALSSDEKIILAAELWRDAVGTDAEEPDPKLVEALRDRLQFYHEHPDAVSTWDAVRSRIVAAAGSGSFVDGLRKLGSVPAGPRDKRPVR